MTQTSEVTWTLFGTPFGDAFPSSSIECAISHFVYGEVGNERTGQYARTPPPERLSNRRRLYIYKFHTLFLSSII
jgi:hypothetical protein